MNLLDKFHSLHSTKIEKTFIGLGTWEKLHLLAERERVCLYVSVIEREVWIGCGGEKEKLCTRNILVNDGPRSACDTLKKVPFGWSSKKFLGI